jgi:hypothetical protein
MQFARLRAVKRDGSNVVVVVVVVVVVDEVASVVVVVVDDGGACVVGTLLVVGGSVSGGLTYMTEITAPATMINISANITFIIPLLASSRSVGLSAVLNLMA